jgi:hypothetical protein
MSGTSRGSKFACGRGAEPYTVKPPGFDIDVTPRDVRLTLIITLV